MKPISTIAFATLMGLIGIAAAWSIARFLLTEKSAPLPQSTTSETTYITTFTLNVQDFSYPDQSAALLEKLITAHEERNIPVEVYLTTTMVDIFSGKYPDFWKHLTTSPVVDISYHIRPPVPYHPNAAETVDWKNMSEKEIYDLVYSYETHGLDLVQGTPSTETGSFKKLTELLGHPATCVGSSSGPETAQIVHRVFTDLGARCVVNNSNFTNLGEYIGALWVRPQHIDIKLFEQLDVPPETLLANAKEEALTIKGAKAPYFLNVKMHDNDFFAEKSAWTTVFLAPGVRKNGPPYDISLKSPLLSEAEQEKILTAYINLLNTTKADSSLSILNLPQIENLLP